MDTDAGPWSLWSDAEDGYTRREDRMSELLQAERGRTLYVSGTVSNQGSAPADVLVRRIADRSTDDYGKSGEERDLILRQQAEVEPLLRATCTHEIDATQPLAAVVAQLVAIGEGAREPKGH